MKSIFKYCRPNNTLYDLITFQQQQRMTKRLSEAELNSIWSQLNMLNASLKVFDGNIKKFKNENDMIKAEAVDFHDKIQAATAIAGMFFSLTKLVHIGYKGAAASGKSLEAINKNMAKEIANVSGEKGLFLSEKLIQTDSIVTKEIKDIISTAISLALSASPIGAALTLTPIFASLYVFGSTNPSRWFQDFKKEGEEMARRQMLTVAIRRDSLHHELRRAGYTPYQTLANPFNK